MWGICKQKNRAPYPLFTSGRPAEGANTVCMNEIRPCCWVFFVLWLHLHDYSNLTMWVIWLCLHVFSEREDNKLRGTQQMLNRGQLCSVVRNDARDCWCCCQNVRFQTTQYVLFPFQQHKCFWPRSSTLLSIFNRLRSPSPKEEKFLLQRQTAEPLTHSAVPGREQTILLTSGGQWCHGDVNPSNCKSHTLTRTRSLALGLW